MTEEERKAKKAERDRRYYEKHKEKRQAQTRAWNKNNKERKLENSRKWREENPERAAEIARKSAKRRCDTGLTKEYEISRYISQRMLRAAKCRAKEKGVPFDLSESDITIPEVCPALGIPISISPGRATDNSPSLDRIIPALGYVRGNVRVISNRANRIKYDATLVELRAVVAYLEKATC